MPKTLLLADDSVTIQKVVGISFASEDVEITTVDNGNDALAKARALRPDVILADVVMPGLSGYEVCEAVKSDPALQHIPVLLLTGTFEAFDEERATRAGAAGHVAKPFEAQTLVDRVRGLLEAAPVAPPVAAAPAAAAPAEASTDSGDDAFDFFAEEASVERAAPVRDHPAASGTDAFADEPLDLDGPDAAFSFDDEELAADVQEPAPAAPLAPSRPPEPVRAFVAEEPTSSAASDAFDFSFDDAPEPAAAAARPSEDLAHTALLDPMPGSDLDVSSSDLAVDVSSGPAAATQVVLSPAEDDGPDFTDTDFDLTDPEPMPAPTAAVERKPMPAPPAAADPPRAPLSASPADTNPRPFGAQLDAAPELQLDAAEAEPIDDDAFDAEPLEAEPIDAEPLEEEALADAALMAEPEALGVDASEEPESLTFGEPESPEALGFDAVPEREATPAVDAAPPAMTPDMLTPAMREELRDTLEKIAWDAFGQVTEKVVREAIERIERAAWEVVPKLAETLIQEEIRRLKGGE